jgi:hypothetical protein
LLKEGHVARDPLRIAVQASTTDSMVLATEAAAGPAAGVSIKVVAKSRRMYAL